MATATMTAEMTETTSQTTTATSETTTSQTADRWVPTPEWFLAGKAEFTVNNDKGQHYSYQIIKKEDRKGGSVWLLTLLNGPDNNINFMYCGLVGADGSLRITRNSKVSAESRSFKVAAWALKQVWSGKPLPAGYSINHKGRCGRCGRSLTRPEGIDPKGYRFGYGETCYKTIMAERARVAEATTAKPVAPQGAAGSAPAPAPDSAEERTNQAVALMQSKMERASRSANRFESAAERFWRANREAIEAEDAAMGINPLY